MYVCVCAHGFMCTMFLQVSQGSQNALESLELASDFLEKQ